MGPEEVAGTLMVTIRYQTRGTTAIRYPMHFS